MLEVEAWKPKSEERDSCWQLLTANEWAETGECLRISNV
jgi:hypothetical protein